MKRRSARPGRRRSTSALSPLARLSHDMQKAMNEVDTLLNEIGDLAEEIEEIAGDEMNKLRGGTHSRAAEQKFARILSACSRVNSLVSDMLYSGDIEELQDAVGEVVIATPTV